MSSGTDARPCEPRPSLAGLKKGTPEYRAAVAATHRWKRKYNVNGFGDRQRASARRAAKTRKTTPEAHERNRAAILLRQRSNKQVLVEMFGGACHRCGWNEHQAGLHFHHTDPARKTRNFTGAELFHKDMMSSEFFEELATCVLLCANCHALEHVRLRDANS